MPPTSGRWTGPSECRHPPGKSPEGCTTSSRCQCIKRSIPRPPRGRCPLCLPLAGRRGRLFFPLLRKRKGIWNLRRCSPGRMNCASRRPSGIGKPARPGLSSPGMAPNPRKGPRRGGRNTSSPRNFWTPRWTRCSSLSWRTFWRSGSVPPSRRPPICTGNCTSPTALGSTPRPVCPRGNCSAFMN